MSSSILVLPYVVEDEERKKPFTHDMEAAAIMCLAEAKRKKLGILGTSPEKLLSISKLHYPLWAVPWGNESIIEDGLEISSYKTTHMELPDIKLFVEDLRRSKTSREVFRSVLKSYAKTFRDFIDSTPVLMDSIVANNELLFTIRQYVARGTALEEGTKEFLALIPPKLDEKATLEKAEKLFENWRVVQSEIKSLEHAVKVLGEEAKFHEEKIAREVEDVRETFENRISQLKLEGDKKIEQLTMERNAKIKGIIETSEIELKVALKERERYEKKLEKLERDKDVFQKRKQIRKRKRDEAGVTYWDHKIRVCKNKISEVKGKLKVLSRFVENTRKQCELGIKKLSESYQGMIFREREKILEVEALRDSRIRIVQKEIEEIESEALRMTNLIGRLLEQKRLHASQLKGLAIPWRLERVTLINVPFYVFRYETGTKSRYHLYPPVVAMGYDGIVRKIQKTVWSFSIEARIKLLLHPRSKALEEMVTSTFSEKMREDKAFSEVVHGLVSSNNLLEAQSFEEGLGKGMEDLEEEGWISQEERNAILKGRTRESHSARARAS